MFGAHRAAYHTYMSLVTYGQKPLKTAKNVKIHQNRPSPSLTKPSKLILGINSAFSAQQHSNCQHKHTHHIYYPYELAPRRYGGHNTTNEAKIRQNTLKSPKSKLDEAKQASSGSQASLKKNSNGSELREFLLSEQYPSSHSVCIAIRSILPISPHVFPV